MIEVGKWSLEPKAFGYHCYAKLSHPDGVSMNIIYDVIRDMEFLGEDVEQYLKSAMGDKVNIDDDWPLLLEEFRKGCSIDYRKHRGIYGINT